MRKHHINFLLKLHKPTSRQLNLLSDGGVEGNRELQLWNFGIILV